jgi:ATP-dependent DNA ligase
LAEARRWFKRVGGNLDGIVAKRLDLPYRSGLRDGMQKIKQRRTADCVVGGFRYLEHAPGSRKAIGSLLLGLYDDEGRLDHVGFTSSFKSADRKKIMEIVKPYMGGAGFSGRAPGGPSRWSRRRSDEWEPLDPRLVVEIEYDHFTGGRFRHGTHLVRWRPDKAPRACTLEQVASRGAGTLKLLDGAQPARRGGRKRTASKAGRAQAKRPRRKTAPTAPRSRRRPSSSRR